jgi:hypothetical protein
MGGIRPVTNPGPRAGIFRAELPLWAKGSIRAPTRSGPLHDNISLCVQAAWSTEVRRSPSFKSSRSSHGSGRVVPDWYRSRFRESPWWAFPPNYRGRSEGGPNFGTRPLTLVPPPTASRRASVWLGGRRSWKRGRYCISPVGSTGCFPDPIPASPTGDPRGHETSTSRLRLLPDAMTSCPNELPRGLHGQHPASMGDRALCGCFT